MASSLAPLAVAWATAASSLAVSSAVGGPLSTTACTRFGSGSSGKGLAAWISPSSCRVTTTTGAVTPSLAAIASVMPRATSAQSASSGAVNSTLPLWMYVAASACPSSPTSARRSAIATLFLPPRLIPRSSATCVAMRPFFPSAAWSAPPFRAAYASRLITARSACPWGKVKLLPIGRQELAEPRDRVGQHLDRGEEHHPDVIGGRQVEPGAVSEQQVLLLKQVDAHPLVIGDLVHLGVEPREQVQRPGRLVAVHAGDRRQLGPRGVPLVAQPPAWQQQRRDVDAAVERRGDRVLGRDVRAHPHVGEQFKAFAVLGDRLARPRDHQPPGPKAGEPVVLRHAAEGEHRQVGRERRRAVVD